MHFGRSDVTEATLEVITSIEDTHSNLVNRARSYASGAQQFGSLDSYSKGKLGPLTVELQQFRNITRRKHAHNAGDDNDVLMTLLVRHTVQD